MDPKKVWHMKSVVTHFDFLVVGQLSHKQKPNPTRASAINMGFNSFLFREALSEYERVLCNVKDKYYQQYILAAGNRAGCLFMTLLSIHPLPS